MKNPSERISLTAHYTGFVWHRNGLSADPFVTPQGRLLFHALQPFIRGSQAVLGLGMEPHLIQRHRILDHLLAEAIETQGFAQVVEFASGLSPRGWSFCRKYGDRIRYVETDLPGMAARKRALLEKEGALGEGHRVEVCDLLATAGDETIEAVLSRTLDPGVPTVAITEGLVNYFPLRTIGGMWRRLASALSGFPQGLYLTDLYPEPRRHPARWILQGARLGIAGLTRGGVYFHFADDAAIATGFRQAGFREVTVHDPSAWTEQLDLPREKTPSLVRVVRAETGAGDS